ncbi:protein prenyltransferase alpha subunit repeat-containing protein 1-like [Tubulanus polymorphus]|uniref:protein prenyltransferase alpha subunit repeat-containing protein 1-like n=1 Tax=Tubulanus polymorphus TaxID=672921 RepID=UPI003DA649F1
MVDSRGSRILADLDAAFRQDPDIDEYDYVPVLEPVQNCSPLVKIERKIGLEMWCVKILYAYAYDKLMSWRRKDARSRDVEPDEINSLSRAVLLINPDVATVWNIRKEQIDRDFATVDVELKLCALILGKHPKSSETFGHRKWLLERWMSTDAAVKDYFARLSTEVKLESISIEIGVVDSSQQQQQRSRIATPDVVKSHVLAEFEICSTAADKYASNYNAWSHRIWTIQHLTGNDVDVLLDELETTKEWVRAHISDHSGFHFRQFLINLLCNDDQLGDDDEMKRILVDELAMSTELVRRFPDHEAIWCHRRFVVTYLRNHPDAVDAFHLANFACENKAFVDTETILAGGGGGGGCSKKSKVERSALDLFNDELEFCKQFEKSKQSTVKRLQKKYKDWLQRTMNE